MGLRDSLNRAARAPLGDRADQELERTQRRIQGEQDELAKRRAQRENGDQK